MDQAWIEATFAGIARFGKGERGFNRLVFSEADWAACDYFAGLMREAGLAVRTDAWGNLIGRLPGTDPGAPAVATGSHLDTVPEGGNYDGGVGSVAGLGALLRLKARGPFRHPLELIVFRGEESSRFGIHTMGSKAMSGLATVEDWRGLKDRAGTTLAEVLAVKGLDLERLPEAVRRRGELKAFVEVHIEQCFVLEQAGIPIGVVEAIAAPIRMKVSVTGIASHSGATPMGKRRDALVTASRIVLAVQEEAMRRADRRIVGTVGILNAFPGALNVVPGRAELWVDLRGIEEASLAETQAAVTAAARRIAEREGTRVEVEIISADTPVPMDPAVIGGIEAACRRLGVPYLRMPSGAGHDAMNMARITAAGMIFIPCRDGISHNPDEYASPADILRGMDVLTETLCGLAV
jgi:beta-ureidopropionase / N-carbamoyl-L-amino-acid hydrolase